MIKSTDPLTWATLPEKEQERVLAMLRKLHEDTQELANHLAGDGSPLADDLRAYAIAVEAALRLLSTRA